MAKVKKVLIVLCWLIVAAGLLYAGYKWDLQINQYLYDPKNKLALWAEAMGWWPLYAGMPIMAFVLAKYGRCAKKVWKKLLLIFAGTAMGFASGVALFVPACKYMAQRGYTFYKGATPFVMAAVLMLVLLLSGIFGKISAGNLLRLRTFAIISIAFMALENGVINIIKTIWDRTRFDTILKNGSDFTRFTNWLTVPGNGGTSFPSGHTAAATGILLTVFLCLLFTQCIGEQKRFVFVGYVYTVIVGVGRVIIGRHYLSDVISAILIVSALTAICYYMPPLRKWIAKVAAEAEILDNIDIANAGDIPIDTSKPQQHCESTDMQSIQKENMQKPHNANNKKPNKDKNKNR